MKSSSDRGALLATKLRSKIRLLLTSLLLIFAFTNLFGEQLPKSFSLNLFNIPKKSSKKNVIFFVTDGMGPASLSLSRSFRQYTQDLPMDDVLNLDKYLIGSSRTRSSSSLITDSAAGATAFSCGLKSYNGAIGVNSEKKPCGTLLEGAKLLGYHTGLVVTTRMTDATPAAFSSHVDYRFQEDLIAQQQLGDYPLGRSVDLMLGGGRTHFYPPSADEKFGTHGSRQDGRNLIQEAQDDGWQYVGSRQEFEQLKLGRNVSLPLLGLFADYDIPFEIDRNHEEYPSLEEEAITAITALTEATKHSDKGFFLLIEGSRIDHAGHQNDPSAQVREVLAFDKAFEAAVNFAKNSDAETILISTSDHETGGLAVARQVTKDYPHYVWYPKILAQAKHSGEYLSKQLLAFKVEKKEDQRSFIEKKIFQEGLGIADYTEEDVKVLLTSSDASEIGSKLNDMVSFRAEIGWSTHGHSSVDVNIYAYANKKDTWMDLLADLQGNRENTDIGNYMAKFLDIDLSEVTKKVHRTKHSPEKFEIESQSDVIDEYYHRISV